MVSADQAATLPVLVVLALLGAVVADASGRRTSAHVAWAVGILAAALFGLAVFRVGPLDLSLAPWIAVRGLALDLGVRGDGLSAVALGLVVAPALVHRIAVPATDGAGRALASLAATGAALVTVADGWVPLLLGWELVAAAVLLLASRADAGPPGAARRVVLTTRVASLCLVAAAVAALASGPEGLDPFATPVDTAAWWLLVLAAATALGVWPLHNWLVDSSSSSESTLAWGAFQAAAAYLLVRVMSDLSGPLSDGLVVAGACAALLAGLAALSSRRVEHVLAFGAAALGGVVLWAAGSVPTAALLLIASGLAARIGLLAGLEIVRVAVQRMDRIDELGGLAGVLPPARWLCMAGALAGGLSGAGLWGQALLLQSVLETRGPPGAALAAAVLAVVALPYLRLAVAVFAGPVRHTALRDTGRSWASIVAVGLALALVVVGAPALAWQMSPPPWVVALVLALAVNALAAIAGMVIWRGGIKAAAPSPMRRFAAGGFGITDALRVLGAAGLATVRGLWTAVDTVLIGGIWGTLGLGLRGAGWLLARAHVGGEAAWPMALAVGTALVVLWSLGSM